MSQNVLTVVLTRDGPFMPWGFRLQGGSDLDHPLTIKRVFLGSPSEGELCRGDIIISIMDRDATKLTHQEAHDVIVSSGNFLKFVVQRVTGATTLFASTPTTPNPVDTGHPLAGSSRTSIQSTSSGIYRGYTPTRTSTLPTVKMGSDYHPKYPEPKSLADYERQDYFHEQQREQQVIHHQVHESVKGTTFSSTSTSSDRTPTPDSGISGSNSGPRVVQRQYNMPFKLHSKHIVSDTMQGQTGVHSGLPNPKMATGAGTSRPLQSHLNTLPEAKRHGINAFGKPKGKIYQSNTFNTLMSTLVVGQSDY
ncbi:PDZ and LIM domain protein 3-like isoform X2 [Tachypleus tridentatus]|uniref:PDZ and LIM domain protein 3-like isoform X2 n=1 Tax=Tachypleus tridentatus TaxID=6853 RepID=UPI003FCFCB06